MSKTEPGFGRIFLALAAFLILGAPLALLAWEELSELLAGHVDGGALLVGVGALVVFVAMILVLRRWVSRLDGSVQLAHHAGEPEAAVERRRRGP